MANSTIHLLITGRRGNKAFLSLNGNHDEDVGALDALLDIAKRDGEVAAAQAVKALAEGNTAHAQQYAEKTAGLAKAISVLMEA